MTNVVEIPPFHIEISPDNPRRDVGDVTELAASIKSVGILEPLLVKPIGKGKDTYQLIAGARRLAAAQVAGRLTVPCIVRDYNDEQRAEIMLIENLQRVDLAPLEEATAFQRLVDEFGWSQDKLAERIGRSQSHVSKRLQLLDLSARARKELDSGGITVGEALELAKLKGSPKLMDQALGHGNIEWAVRNTIAERARGEKRAAVVQSLKAKGVRILTDKDVRSYGAGAPQRIGKSSYEPRFQAIDVKAHATEPCHAAYVQDNYDDVTAVYYCTKPGRHSKGGKGKDAGDSEIKTGLTDAEKAKRRAKIEHNRARRAAQEVRDAFVEMLLKKRIGIQEAAELVIASWRDHTYGTPDRVCKRLGVTPSNKDSYRTREIEALGATMTSPSEVARVAVLLAIEAFEAPLRTDYPDFGGASAYFAFLARHGYEISDVEKLELAGKRPR